MANPAIPRVLTVLDLLQPNGRMSGAELAQRLEVDRRTLRRYIARLEEIGIPITTERGPHGGYRLICGYRLPPMMFTNDEALVLALGLVASLLGDACTFVALGVLGHGAASRALSFGALLLLRTVIGPGCAHHGCSHPPGWPSPGRARHLVNVVGGITIDEPAAALAMAVAIASSLRGLAVRADTVLIGEVGLSGELRMVGQMPARLREAAKLGLRSAIVPKRLRRLEPWPDDIQIVEARSLRQALDHALLADNSPDQGG